MDHEPVTGSRSPNPDDRNGITDASTHLDNEPSANVARGKQQQSLNGEANRAEDGVPKPFSPEHDKGDSEAETVVLSGKEVRSGHKITKAIKLEEAVSGSEAEHLHARGQDDCKSNDLVIPGSRRPSLKRKRGTEEPKTYQGFAGHDSSALSSTASSPPPRVRSPKSSEPRSDGSRSSPPIDDGSKQNGKLRKLRGPYRKKSSHNKQNKPTETKDGRERRETRSATHYDEHSHRSESPPSRRKGRARSIQSSLPQGVTKRRKPPPLYVERRRKESEDVNLDSDDSSSVHSHHRFQKLNYMDGHAMSPAKVSHKKNRDRNGRTLLARACTQGYEEAERWVRERPQDINTPDNAGNTPLQIASLAGQDEVVELLLDAGCDATCKNIDLDTPLIDAVENSHLQVVKLLLKAGVDPRQRNAKGQEPLELVNMDDEDGENIRIALLQARRDSDATRRQSEDHRQHSARDLDTPPDHTSGASPTESHRSPPPVDNGGRRRTARSVPTKDALLWVNPTPQRLREEAGRGNIELVDHILRMRPEADIQSVLAAVKGGHTDVLEFMIAFGSPDPDPEPLRSADHKADFSTPMLAAIGRGNLDIIQLLLDQPGFDPTRRMFKNLTYPELAKERQGLDSETEYKMLQKAFDDHLKKDGRRSNTTSPRKVRAKRAAPTRDSPEPSTSPHEARKVRKPNPPVEEQPEKDVKYRTSHQDTTLRSRDGDRAASIAEPQRELALLGPPKSRTTDGHHGSDAGLTGVAHKESLKPRRKLMSGNDLKTDQEAKQKAKPVVELSPSSTKDPPKPRSRQSFSTHDRPRTKPEESVLFATKAKKASSEEPACTKQDSGKKRLRVSVSPQASRSDSVDIVKKKKRLRLDSQGKAINQDFEHPAPVPPAMVANMVVASPTAVTSPIQGAAPVAFMGAPTASPVTTSSAEAQNGSTVISPAKSLEQAVRQSPERNDTEAQAAYENSQSKVETGIEAESRRIKIERDQEQETERERQAMLEREAAEHRALMDREAEVARLDAQRQAEEAERQAQLDREAEEARIAKIKRDEELQRRRIEDERQRKEEQERRRRDREERESLRRMRQQQEEERSRRENLPNGLRRAVEIGPERAKDRKEITKWLPLRTVTAEDLGSNYEGQVAGEQWVANIQAAPILANPDLELSQCKPTHALLLLIFAESLVRYCLDSSVCHSKPRRLTLAPTSQPNVCRCSFLFPQLDRRCQARRRDQTQVPRSKGFLDQAFRLYGHRT